MSFENRVAIVTGGASGIGRALCEELGRRGAMVVAAPISRLASRSPGHLDAVRDAAARCNRLVDDTCARTDAWISCSTMRASVSAAKCAT